MYNTFIFLKFYRMSSEGKRKKLEEEYRREKDKKKSPRKLILGE